MDTWLGKDQQHGRLNLVLGRTEGTAQNWLARKREEMEKLLAAGTVTEKLLTEWSEVQSDFIHEMSKGVTPAMYEQQLRALKLKDKEGNLDPTNFIRRFDDICARLYPPSRWTDQNDRSRVLAGKFEERVKYGGAPDVWDATWLILISTGIAEDERTVEHWQDALLQAWSYKAHTSRGQDSGQRGRGGAGRGRGGGQSGSATQHTSAAAMEVDDGAGEEGQETAGDGQRLSAAAGYGQRGGGQRGGRGGGGERGRDPASQRPHWSAERQKLYDDELCFRCGGKGHKAKGCSNEPLKGKAGQ
jgi:hypothetical protein